MGKHHGKGGKSGLGKTLGIVGFAAGFAFPGAFLGAAAGTAGAARLSAALMGLSLGTTIGSAISKQCQDMPASDGNIHYPTDNNLQIYALLYITSLQIPSE